LSVEEEREGEGRRGKRTYGHSNMIPAVLVVGLSSACLLACLLASVCACAEYTFMCFSSCLTGCKRKEHQPTPTHTHTKSGKGEYGVK